MEDEKKEFVQIAKLTGDNGDGGGGGSDGSVASGSSNESERALGTCLQLPRCSLRNSKLVVELHTHKHTLSLAVESVGIETFIEQKKRKEIHIHIYMYVCEMLMRFGLYYGQKDAERERGEKVNGAFPTMRYCVLCSTVLFAICNLRQFKVESRLSCKKLVEKRKENKNLKTQNLLICEKANKQRSI